MAWVKFTSDYNYRPKVTVTIAYKADMVMNVPAQCAALAIAAGKAIRMGKASKDAEPVEVDGAEHPAGEGE